MSDEKFIKTNHKPALKQYLYSFLPKDMGGEVDFELLASSKTRNRNYSRIDIFILLQFAQGSDMDFPTLLRTLFYELAQFFPPEELIKRISNNAHKLYVDKGSHDGTSPTGMLEFIGDTSEEFANYSSLLSGMMHSEKLRDKPMDEEAKAEILEFLGTKAENASVGFMREKRQSRGQKKSLEQDEHFSKEEWAKFYGIVSPLGLAFLGRSRDLDSGKRFREEVMKMDTDGGIPRFKEVLVPLRDIECEGLPLERREEIVGDMRGGAKGRVVIAWNRTA